MRPANQAPLLLVSTRVQYSTCVCKILFLGETQGFSLLAAGLFLRPRLWRAQGARMPTTAQMRVPNGLRRACSVCSELRMLASSHGILFRPAREKQTHGPKRVLPAVLWLTSSNTTVGVRGLNFGLDSYNLKWWQLSRAPVKSG